MHPSCNPVLISHLPLCVSEIQTFLLQAWGICKFTVRQPLNWCNQFEDYGRHHTFYIMTGIQLGLHHCWLLSCLLPAWRGMDDSDANPGQCHQCFVTTAASLLFWFLLQLLAFILLPVVTEKDAVPGIHTFCFLHAVSVRIPSIKWKSIQKCHLKHSICIKP